MSKRFEGYYFKHQRGANTLALIVGRCETHAFLQVLTASASHSITYPLESYISGGILRLPGCEFGKAGVELDVNTPELKLKGRLHYTSLTPLATDIMGPFRHLPMQCRHGIVSMRHDITGSLLMGDTVLDFQGGLGYIEGDSGIAFPKHYLWVQCNDFVHKAAVLAAVADIPPLHFRGCIAVVWLEGKEYRFATYRGVKILQCGARQLTLRQGRYILDITLPDGEGQRLQAPQNGQMTRVVTEIAACKARFCLMEDNKTLLDETSDNASYEFVE